MNKGLGTIGGGMRRYGCAYAVIVCATLLLLGKAEPQRRPRPAKPVAKLQAYTIDLSQSTITAFLTQEGLIARRYPRHEVAIKTFSGKIGVSPKDETQVAVVVETETKSFTNVDKGMSDFERKEFHSNLQNVVLEIEKFPTIKFVSVSVSDVEKNGDVRNFTLTGDLTMHGVTKRVAFPVSVTMAEQELRATGEAKIKQSEFGLKPFEKGMGLIKVADEVKIVFAVIAKTQ